MNKPSQKLTHALIQHQAQARPNAVALRHKDATMTYAALWQEVLRLAALLIAQGLRPGDRVAVFLPKQFETVISFYAANLAGGLFVPVNPILKPSQVTHILCDSGARFLITSAARLAQLGGALDDCSDLQTLLLVDDFDVAASKSKMVDWRSMIEAPQSFPQVLQHNLAALLYTSGSTGLPKGVMLTHDNLVLGAMSVAEYLQATSDDCLLALLPFSFDYGLSQLHIAFLKGACVVLFDYLLPQDVPVTVARYQVTGLAAIPTLWATLAKLSWPDQARVCLKYATSSGGAMPAATLDALRDKLPNTRIYLMYGLTEAFRSTWLPPDQIDRRPGSMGKAIPRAELYVLDADNQPCPPDVPGQLVHTGALVSQGYWRDPDKTAAKFGFFPDQQTRAVWSGDRVRRDADGYFYFIGRMDEMIKTSGYRVSPLEVEQVAQQVCSGELVAIGVPHPELGQAVLLVSEPCLSPAELIAHCRKQLPAYMVPSAVVQLHALPHNANHKIDRALLQKEYAGYFST